MSSFTVDPHSIAQLRSTLDQLTSTLTGIRTSVNGFDPESLGGGLLPGELGQFNADWEQGVTIVGGEISSLSTALSHAIAGYEQTEHRVASAARNTGGAVRTHGSGHHRAGRGTGTTTLSGKGSSADGSGTGTTTLFGPSQRGPSHAGGMAPGSGGVPIAGSESGNGSGSGKGRDGSGKGSGSGEDRGFGSGEDRGSGSGEAATTIG